MENGARPAALVNTERLDGRLQTSEIPVARASINQRTIFWDMATTGRSDRQHDCTVVPVRPTGSIRNAAPGKLSDSVAQAGDQIQLRLLSFLDHVSCPRTKMRTVSSSANDASPVRIDPIGRVWQSSSYIAKPRQKRFDRHVSPLNNEHRLL